MKNTKQVHKEKDKKSNQQNKPQQQPNCLSRIYKCLCCISDPKYPHPYQFEYSGRDHLPENKEAFESNFVSTTKYNAFTFLPKGLILQFQRIANVYFLIISILQSIPQISPLNPLTAWVPLLIVLSISMLRQGLQLIKLGYEDYQRYKSDKQMNEQLPATIRRNGQFVKTNWSEVVVGDICKVQTQQLFPADLILLSSSTEGGIAFIQTASLDGQKNLKPRNAYKQTACYSTQNELNSIRGSFSGSIPLKDLHKFEGTLIIDQKKINFDGDAQYLYRGTRLKNTQWVYGLVVYTGKNTKIMINSATEPINKMSQIQTKVNFILFFIFILQVVICFILAIIYGIFRNKIQQNNTYILWSTAPTPADAILIFLTYFVLINTMIPISLIVSIQIVKFSQSYFINSDRLMYSQFRKKYSQVKSASLNQQLGQIQYIFTDKTGTLTMNIMDFKIAVIGSQMYGDLGLILNDPNYPPQNQKGFHDQKLKKLVVQGIGNQPTSPQIIVKSKQGKSIKFQGMRELAEQYLKLLAIAHQVVPCQNQKGQRGYQGQSPDQICLVNAAKQMGIQFLKSTQSTTKIRHFDKQVTYQLLQCFKFTSDRKRMSVIVRQNNGTIKMYTKGADSIVKDRLAKGQTLNLDQELKKFSRIGLRTLLIAMRIISNQQYQQFRNAVSELPLVNKKEKLELLINNLQTDLYLIGATAVQDKLQQDVPETIRDLIRANIKIWMLTGDKMQTAENIAKSCNLIQDHFQVIKCQPQQNSKQDLLQYFQGLVKKSNQLTQRQIPKAFLIQGKQLTQLLKTQQGQIQLANLAAQCQAVVCCRLSPQQKATIVKIVKTRLNKITLSIGDGSNDVPMIKQAHIGVGLFGFEGMGAVQASDYALPQFRMLWRLLLVHGRWNYIRISEMILYFFYKNMLFTIPQIVFAFYSGYSGQTMFEDYYITLYNLTFTSMPLVIRAILQQDLNYVYQLSEKDQQNRSSALLITTNTLAKQNNYLPPGYRINKYFYRLFPKIYFIGQENCIFNYFNYFMWVLEGFIEAILISLFCIYIIGSASLNQTGINSDWWIVGLTIYSSIVLVVTFKLATHTKFWSLIFFLICSFSLGNYTVMLGLYAMYTWISNYYLSDSINGTAYIAWTTGQTYFVVLFCVCLILALDGAIIFLDFIRGGYASKMRQVVRVQQQANRAYLSQLSLKISQGLSAVAQKK